MKPFVPRFLFSSSAARCLSVILAITLFTFPLCAQQPTNPPAKAAAPVEAAPKAAPTFDTLLSADSYKLYGEVRNVGGLLTSGGAGEIVEPIIKLADPGPEFNSIVAFLKKNSEALATSRLMFASWPARTDIPTTFVAIEFATPDEASKFAPQLEKFLPTVLPPIPVQPEEKKDEQSVTAPATENAAGAEKTASAAPSPTPKAIAVEKQQATPTPAETSPEPQPRFQLTHSGNLVFITDKAFKIEKLQSKSVGLLSEDHNFRVARDRFSAEPVFVFLNVALEDRTRPKPLPKPVMTEEEEKRIQAEAEAEALKEIEEERIERERKGEPANPQENNPNPRAVLTVAEPSPTPTPTKEEEAQKIASNQIGSMLSTLGQGEPQWPDAVGFALALDNDAYVVRAILIDSDNSKRLTLPFIPQLISGPAYAVEAPSVLPDDTEIVASASIDFSQTYREMKKQAEASLASSKRSNQTVSAQTSLDSFAEFEKKAGFKIADELLPVLGNELAVATSLKMMNQVGVFGMPSPAPSKSSGKDDTGEKEPDPLPIFLVAIKDREAARRLMPRVLDGLGIGAANLLAQVERRGDAEIVNYAGFLAYGFVGNFLVISDAVTVRRVADASTNHQTLSSNNIFRNARQWQPKQTKGEIYVSPALMESYQDQVGTQAANLDPAIRDFLMQLSPTSSAITYALSHDGLGAIHEVHLPKNLILAMVAGTSAAMSAMKQGSPEMNEMIATGLLQMIASQEEMYKSGAGKGSYGSLDTLTEQKLLQKDVLDKYGYKFDVVVSGNRFEATATPVEYGKSGKRSFFIDQTGVVRGDDHGGGAASSADKPVEP